MKFKYLLTLCFLIAFNSLFFAPPHVAPGRPNGCWPACVPIDGGISLLVAAGAVYGGKKLYFDKKNKKTL